MKKKIISLSGYAKSGKDTTAEILVRDHGYVKMAFADLLRTAVLHLNPILAWDHKTELPIRVADALRYLTYEEAKTKYLEYRRLLQFMGTEVGRMLFGTDFWVDKTFEKIEFGDAEKIVIADCRFRNEARATQEHGGIVVRIDRPGIGPINAHESEVGLDDWVFDYRIENNGTIANLATKVEDIVKLA